jgi:hypothetical protein
MNAVMLLLSLAGFGPRTLFCFPHLFNYLRCGWLVKCLFVKAVAMVFASKIQGRSRYGMIFAILLTL